MAYAVKDYRAVDQRNPKTDDENGIDNEAEGGSDASFLCQGGDHIEKEYTGEDCGFRDIHCYEYSRFEFVSRKENYFDDSEDKADGNKGDVYWYNTR